MVLEVLQQIADALADLPERLAALMEEEPGREDRENDARAREERSARWEKLERGERVPTGFGSEWALGEGGVAQLLPAAARDLPDESASPAKVSSWPDSKEVSGLPALPAALPVPLEEQQPISPVASWGDERAEEVALSGAVPVDDFAEMESPPRAKWLAEEEIPHALPVEQTTLNQEGPLLSPGAAAVAADFESFQPVGGPAQETPGAGGSDMSRMVALLERIAVAVESLQRSGGTNGAVPDSEGGGQGGYGRRMASWAQQQARDFDAEEDFPAGSPSVNVSSQAGLSGASSVARGMGSGYRKRTSRTSAGQRQQTSPAAAKVFTEPGGHVP